MKANETPEKIYLTSDEKNSYVFTQKRSDGKGIEYTRTDASIDKACTFLETYPHMFMGVMRTEMIDEFRKYMKGE